MPEAEFLKFLGTLKPIVRRSSGLALTAPDDFVLRIVGELILRIDQGINLVDKYVTLNQDPSLDPIAKAFFQKDGFLGDPARKRLQKLIRTNLNDENNIYSCFR
jgi:hypothetical protein